MAEKVYSIRINGLNESIDGTMSLADALKKLDKTANGIKSVDTSMNELAKTTKKLDEYNVDYQKSLQAAKNTLSDMNKQVKESLEIEKANLTVLNDSRSSYAEKQRLLTSLGKVIRTMTTETDEDVAKQQELITKYQELNSELKDFDAVMGNHYRNVGNYNGAIDYSIEKHSSLKSELKQLQSEMANLLNNGVSKLDPRFLELARKAGKIEDSIGDAREEVRRFASDTRRFDDVINVVRSATGAFQLFQGAMELFGKENEKVNEAIKKLMAISSVVQALQTLQNTMKTGSATAIIYQKAMKLLNLEWVTAEVGAIKAAKASTQLTKAQKTATIATKGFNLALKATIIMAVITFLAELTLNFDQFEGKLKEAIPWLNNFESTLDLVSWGLRQAGRSAINTALQIGKLFQVIWYGITMQPVKAYETAKSIVTDYVNLIKDGADDILNMQKEYRSKRLKAVSEGARKEKEYELDMLKAKLGDQAKYSEDGIKLQKKIFALRKKEAQGNADELRQIAIDEANFERELQARGSNGGGGGGGHSVVSTSSFGADLFALNDAKIKKGIKNAEIAINAYQRLLNSYINGPLDKLKKTYDDILILEKSLTDQSQEQLYNNYLGQISEASSSLTVTMDGLKKVVDNILKDPTTTDNDILSALGIPTSSADKNKVLKIVYELASDIQEVIQGSNENKRGFAESFSSGLFNELEQDFKEMQKLFKSSEYNPEKMSDDSVLTPLGFISVSKTKAKLQEIIDIYNNMFYQVSDEISKVQRRRDQHLNFIETTLGISSDTQAYREIEEKYEDFLNKLYDMQAEYGEKVNDLMAKQDIGLEEQLNAFLPKARDLLEKINETVMEPITSTFSMYLDFAMEEMQQKLDQVSILHDEASKKVEDSANRISELNEQIRDSNNENLKKTKEQLADEQLLYAQRLEEEKKLQEEETNLKNEIAMKDYQSKKLELMSQIPQAIANTAQGATKALAQWGWPLGGVFAAMLTALGGAQVALITSQLGKLKPVKYADGGVIEGASHAHGGVKVLGGRAEVEGGEYIVNKESTKKYYRLLEAINDSKHSSYSPLSVMKFKDGGMLNADSITSSSNMFGYAQIADAISSIDMNPVVSVVDINRANNRLVTVKGLAGVG